MTKKKPARLAMLRPRISEVSTTRVAVLAGTPGATQRDRGRPWRRLRAEILLSAPLCAHCSRAGRVTLATEVDHRVPLSQGGTDDRDNLDPLCRACHLKKSAMDARP